MQINIKTSEANQNVVRTLTNKLPIGTKENVIARIALAYSLQKGRKFTSEEFYLYDSKGKEYKDQILFDVRYRDFYIALICQYYGIYKTDDNIPKYIKLHIDHGLELMDKIFQENNNYPFIDFLVEHIEKGLAFLEDTTVSLDAVMNNNQYINKSYYTDLISLEVGKTISPSGGDVKPIVFEFNNTNLYNNSHIAVAGNSGTGKTQFALDLIAQIIEKSNGQVNYIYLDFKGLKNDDILEMQPFFYATSTTFVNVPEVKFPINPLTFIDNVNDVNKRMGIDKFVDIVCKYSNLGVKQRGLLREAVVEAFLKQAPSEYPSVRQINEELLKLVENKQDTLTEIMGELSRFDVCSVLKKVDSC